MSDSETDLNSETGPNSETEPNAEPASIPPDAFSSADASSLPWQRWLIPAIAGALGVGMGAVITFFVVKGIGPAEESDPMVSGGADAVAPVDEEAARAEEFRQRQQYVSDVVNQLGREVLIGDSPTRGNPDASVMLIKFSDFQCPFCADAATEAERFVDGHEAEVLFVYKHLLLTQIPTQRQYRQPLLPGLPILPLGGFGRFNRPCSATKTDWGTISMGKLPRSWG